MISTLSELQIINAASCKRYNSAFTQVVQARFVLPVDGNTGVYNTHGNEPFPTIHLIFWNQARRLKLAPTNNGSKDVWTRNAMQLSTKAWCPGTFPVRRSRSGI